MFNLSGAAQVGRSTVRTMRTSSRSPLFEYKQFPWNSRGAFRDRTLVSDVSELSEPSVVSRFVACCGRTDGLILESKIVRVLP